MKCDHLREYLRVSELFARWRVDKAATDIHWAIMKGVLKPCIWVRGEYAELSLDGNGGLELVEVAGAPVARAVNAWCYPCNPTQVDAYELAYTHVCDRSGEEPVYLALPEPLLLSDLIARGVVLMDALAEAEAALKVQQEDELHGKERLTLYRLLVSSVCEQYGWDPAGERSTAVADLVRCSDAYGIPVSYNAAKEHLRRAWAKCPPKVD